MFRYNAVRTIYIHTYLYLRWLLWAFLKDMKIDSKPQLTWNDDVGGFVVVDK